MEYVLVYAKPLQYSFKNGNAFFRKRLVLKTHADCVFSPGELDTSNNKTTAKGRELVALLAADILPPVDHWIGDGRRRGLKCSPKKHKEMKPGKGT